MIQQRLMHHAVAGRGMVLSIPLVAGCVAICFVALQKALTLIDGGGAVVSKRPLFLARLWRFFVSNSALFLHALDLDAKDRCMLTTLGFICAAECASLAVLVGFSGEVCFVDAMILLVA